MAIQVSEHFIDLPALITGRYVVDNGVYFGPVDRISASLHNFGTERWAGHIELTSKTGSMMSIGLYSDIEIVETKPRKAKKDGKDKSVPNTKNRTRTVSRKKA